MAKARDEVRIPDVEIIIQASASDVAAVCFYFAADVHGAAEVVTSVSDPSAIPHLVEVLRQAITSLNAQDWYTVDGLDTRPVSDEQNDPF